MTVHEKTRYMSKIAILENAHLRLQTSCYFMLKSGWPNGDKITSVMDNDLLFSAFYSSRFILSSSAETSIFLKNESVPGFLRHQALKCARYRGKLALYRNKYRQLKFSHTGIDPRDDAANHLTRLLWCDTFGFSC